MADLNAIFHHIVLPPTLPSSQDEDTFAVGKALLDRLVQACHTLRIASEPSRSAAACNGLVTALGVCSSVYGKRVDRELYQTALQSIISTQNQVLAFYIGEQNAALLVYCHDEDVVFEAFEASPQSQNVLATPNALLWKFPSRAARIPRADIAGDDNLQLALVSFLSKATSEHLSQFDATSEKAGVCVGESRNPGSPALITHMLLSVIETLGSQASVHVLKKRVRDDVQFRNAPGGTSTGGGPWRRHPFWLILRVAVRRQLQLSFGTEDGHVAYKLLLTMVTANLLRDVVIKRMEVATVDLLRKKLCRRLAKLEKLPITEGVPWRLDAPPTKAFFQEAVSSANEYIQTEFNSFKLAHVRRVPRLPQRVDLNSDSLRLTLPNSLPYLRQLSLRYIKQPGWLEKQSLACNSDDSDLDSKLKENPAVLHARGTYNEVSSLLYKLSDATKTASKAVSCCDDSEEEPKRLCQKMSKILDDLIGSLPPMSSDDTELNSQVCLTLFSLWMNLDELATKAFPMLLDYRPPFSPELLNVLQLSCLSDMERARQIQSHLRRRCETANFHDRTIFGTLDQRCFGARFTQSSPPLLACLSEIRELERIQREKKKVEWEQTCKTYVDLSTEMASLPCTCEIDSNGELYIYGCEHCFTKRKLRRLKIDVCENLLPEDDNLAAAIVFDLNVPAAFSAYRSTSWTLVRQFAYPVRPAMCGKTKKLSDNRDLHVLRPALPIFNCKDVPAVCLASSKKAFMQTHYQAVRMWAELDELLLPHGSAYAMYDVEAKTWVSGFDRPMTLAHLCGISIPGPLTQVFPRPAHPPTHPEGPSSYEAVANRPQCPGDLSPHEFEAYHYLLAGRARRWLTLLVELGSSNLNFNKDDTLLTCTHLVHEIGPETSPQDTTDSHGLILGTCHTVFSDDHFVDQLLKEIQNRMDMIRSSWRETNSMDFVLTLSLTIYVRATNADQRRQAQDFVRNVRTAMLQWIDSLRKEGEKSAEASSSASRYSFRAALLGRRTFALLALNRARDHEGPYSHSLIGPADVTEYLKLSIALQQNRVVDLDRLSRMDKMMLRRDATLAVELQNSILDAAVQYPEAVGEAVGYSIGMDKEAVTSFMLKKIHRDRHCGWITAVISTASGPQQVDLDCLEGHILVDGKTLRKLPDDIRDAEDVKELFGQRHLLTYQSNVPGAVCRLAAPVEGFYVHFGRHIGIPVIIAEGKNGSLSDFVPRRIFIDKENVKYDLPRGLVDDCVHWYDRNTGSVEICRKPDIWRSKDGNWKLQVATQQARRRNVLLVDPHASISKTVAGIFRGFEDSRRLTVYQPTTVHASGKTATLKVELRHLDLSFSANRWGRLECAELDAEIDPDQDAGTLYGYESMIVMRELGDPNGRRSIIAPLGPLIWSPRGVHISLRANIDDALSRKGAFSRKGYKVTAQEKAYVRLTIDSVLGRLVCPPDTRLLYTKAQLHAFTSFPSLPDPLTGRTGEEEATATLLSGLCQPWEPLDVRSTEILRQIRQLCPQRAFYPKDKRALQQVSLDPFLPPGVQHDRYGRLVDRILRQSDALMPFREGGQEPDGPANTYTNNSNDNETACLHVRAETQRLRFETPQTHREAMLDSQNFDVKYKSLGHSTRFEIAGVQEITKMLRDNDVSITEDLFAIFEKWDHIGGKNTHQKNIGEMSLAELMAVNTMKERWGSLVALCTSANAPQQTAEMILTLAVMAFSPGVDLDAVRWLAAFFSVQLLKDVSFPPFSVFSGFKLNEVPTQEFLESLIRQAYPLYSYSKTGPESRDIEDIGRDRDRHWALCKQEGADLARRIMLNWPEDLESEYHPPTAGCMIGMNLALEKVAPQWQRLQHNWQLSRYAEKVTSIMQEQRALGWRIQMTEQMKNKSWRAKAEEAGSLLGRQMAPCNVVPRLHQDLARRAMSWTPSRTALPNKTGRESATSRGTGTIPYKPSNEVLTLGHLISQFMRFSKRKRNGLRIHYGTDLETSLRALKRMHIHQLQQQGNTQETDALPSHEQVEQQSEMAQRAVCNWYQAICRSLADSSDTSWLQQAGLWPRLTPTTILELLRSTAPPVSWGAQVHETLVQYGCALAELQQLRRIQRAMKKGDTRRVLDETCNLGHANWQPNDHPDWLLLELDSDMMIRAQQVDVARALLAPESQANSVLQLNMGQGKTSCIVPMAMAALADGHQLARLVVPKALLLPTAQMVQSRLGGLVGREIRQVAFSRRLLSRHDIHGILRTYEDHHNDLLHRRGILLVAPEHLLAFKLCGLQCLADCQGETTLHQPGRRERTQLGLARRMLALQDRLANGLCRDVLDESDVILAARTQLVYPSGAQTAVDGAPQRWKLAQVLLGIVEDQLPDLCHRFPHSISSVPRGAEEDGGHGFPIVQILQMDYIQEPLHSAILGALSGGQATMFSGWAPGAAGVAAAKKQRILHNALQNDSTAAAVEAAANLFADFRTARDGLMLVRGLLSHRILLACLRKRWNVQYGLHPERYPIAVPYEAKGVPSDRSEFGHPDVAILLTCLAFYYAGLTREQFRDGLRHVLCHHDDPVTAYAHWTAGGAASLPIDLQQWNVINPNDENQVCRLWCRLRLTRPVVDHYLNTFVFPAHARQFSVKLQASAWDVPLGKRKKGHLSSKARTTGFSGTNDNRAMLPLTIQQLDLPHLVQTNAEVLTYLLQDRNREYQCCMNLVYSDVTRRSLPIEHRWSEDQLLHNLKDRGIRVLIDAGAYVLERDNKSLARAWLKIDPKAPAAIFFGENDNRAMVLFRDDTAGCLPLVATPFVDDRRLGECLVYFDEAHTRGVDLLLPAGCRGGLTLALGQTKDHTVQAAMRLRQLGTTQSIIWYAPPEVDRSIRHVWHSVTGDQLPNFGLQSSHVLLWLLEQTCATNEQLHPLFLSQGYDFCRRSAAEKRYRRDVRPENDSEVYQDDADSNNSKDSGIEYDWCREIIESNRKARKQLVNTLQQPERMTLDRLYGWSEKEAAGNSTAAAHLSQPPRQAQSQPGLVGIFQQLLDRGYDHSRQITTAAFEEVEQEREVEVQVEQVRKQKTKVHFVALNFPGRLHWAIESFLSSAGTLPSRHGLHQVFASIARSEMGRRHEVNVAGTTSELYVSLEFERTIVPNGVKTGGKERPKQTTEPSSPADDQFFRPVQWLLWSRLTNTAIVVVPEEAELLLLRLRRGTTTAQVHLLVYSAAVTRAMVSLSSGKYYAVPALPSGYSLPSWFTIESGILGGRLYMDFSESEAMRTYLESAVAQGSADGSRSFCPNIASFLLDWLPLRRVGQDIAHTPAAYICQGRPLQEDHAFFVRK